MVTKRAKDGSLYREPPYTDIECLEFYRAFAEPPTIVGGSRPRGTQPTQAQQQRRQRRAAKRRGAQQSSGD
jgi:hypothetical protein